MPEISAAMEDYLKAIHQIAETSGGAATTLKHISINAPRAGTDRDVEALATRELETRDRVQRILETPRTTRHQPSSELRLNTQVHNSQSRWQ
jgi:hypothetical protein